MLTLDEKMQEIELSMLYITAVNNVLFDAISQAESSDNDDYTTLLELQKNYIKKVTNLF